MKKQTLKHQSTISAPVEVVFRWHTQPGAFERFSPPWENIKLISQSQEGLQNGSQTVLQMPMGPFKKTWVAQFQNVIENQQFEDIQLQGPFAYWHHRHLMQPANTNTCEYIDDIEYILPFAPLSHFFAGGYVHNKLKRTFIYRHHTLQHDLDVQKQFPVSKPLKFLISGSSGLIGSNLISFLKTAGHLVIRMVRRKEQVDSDSVYWNPADKEIDKDALENFDVVIHLAGENIASGRWTPAKKEQLRQSRVEGTRLLSKTLAQLNHPPEALICASALGFYGDRGDEILTEDSPPGNSFLSDLCCEWEKATQPAADKGIRTVNVRIGIVLTPAGGALSRMLLPFKLGLGGPLGNGKQYMSWIAIDDLLYLIYHTITNPNLSGPVNAVSPDPVTNKEFTRTFAKVLHRPAIFPVPAFALRLAQGQMADELLFASARIKPAKLLENNHQFHYPTLKDALRHVLGKIN